MAKELDNHINRLLRRFDLSKQTKNVRQAITELKQNMSDARVYAVDYELSETREDQLRNAKEAKKWLESAGKNILAVSQHDIFNAVDTAHLSALTDQIGAQLK
jgi:Zn-dependent M32 family carboxypeptidase